MVEITSISSGLNINIGTLNVRSICSMFLAGKKANELGHAVLLDPVGAGASSLRTNRIIDAIYKMTGEELERGANYEVR